MCTLCTPPQCVASASSGQACSESPPVSAASVQPGPTPGSGGGGGGGGEGGGGGGGTVNQRHNTCPISWHTCVHVYTVHTSSGMNTRHAVTITPVEL